MKRWLIRLYPHSWRRRYGDEFLAVLEQDKLTALGVVDIVRGALDAHWRVITMEQQQGAMLTFSFSVRRNTLKVLAAILLVYLASYGMCRAAGLLVHTSQNRHTPSSRHHVRVSRDPINPTAPLALVYAPLRVVESSAWPLVDLVTGS